MVLKKLLSFALILTLLLGILSGCNNASDDKIVVSGKMWTEQYILTHMIAELLKEKTDLTVEVKEGLGEVSILTPALEKGDIDIYVEYTGTGLEAVLKEKVQPGEAADEILARVRKGYKEKYNVVWLEALGFENTYTLAYRKGEGIEAKTYSDLSEYASELIFGAPHQFYEREDGYDALAETYGFSFKEKKSYDPNIMYEALKKGDVDIIPAFTTDGRIERYDLGTTKDDKGFFPPYYAVPIVRQEVLDAHPEVEEVLNLLAGQISEEDMTSLNAKVDIDQEDPREVARQFLKEKGLIN
ncbi:glycine betaine ABC transporter substrate-binding protein [Aeribacillus pallidus]|uniref:glycine betaine ABC transporter substrate-binding protein n=1 Tax=Aeribacillus pallidus TaxID=33936 RepID=UPI003D2444D3